MKEKDIEKSIVKYLISKWAWCEQLQAWSIIIKKWPYTNRMNLCSNWTPDIIAFYNWEFIAIEVKKNQAEVDDWIKKEIRYKKESELPKSYKRELAQIKHKQLILENLGTHIITCSLKEVKEFINNL